MNIVAERRRLAALRAAARARLKYAPAIRADRAVRDSERRIVRPAPVINWDTPWELDPVAQRIVAEKGDLSRREISELCGVSVEAVRLAEVSACARFAKTAKRMGIDADELREHFDREDRRHALDNDLEDL